MAYNVSQDFTNKLYSGESNFRAILTIGENTIDNDQIASISISSPIIDDSKQVFYVGSFISQKITIKFKNMDGIDVHSGDNVDLSIGQYVNNEWVDVPIGKFLVDDLAEDYFEKCEISCLDYAVKFKPNIDYSLCFTDGKATIKEILEYICDYFNVEIGDYPTINDDVEIGTYDSTVSGKQWISYIAELKGCNAKIDRLGRLTLQPLKQPSNVPINALESASFELGEEFNITKVTFFDAIRNYTYGDDEGNTLFIRQDNPFITDTKVVQNIYDNLCVDKYSASGKSFDIEDADAHPINVNTIYGETSQKTLTGKNKFSLDNLRNTTVINVARTTINNSELKLNGTTSGAGAIIVRGPTGVTLPAGTYTVSIRKASGSITTNNHACAFYIRKPNGTNIVGLNVNSFASADMTSASFTLTENTEIYKEMYCNSGNYVFNNLVIDFQIEEGSVVTPYEEYCGGIPSPNPDYPQDVNTVKGSNNLKIVGKNLLKYPYKDTSKEQNGLTFTDNGDGTLTITGTATADTIFDFYQNTSEMLVSDTTKTYTLSSSIDATNWAFQYYERYNNTWNYKTGGKTLSFTPSSEATGQIFRLLITNNTQINGTFTFQLEQGSTATDYDTYEETIKPINLPVENYIENAESFASHTDFETLATLTNDYYNNCRIRNADFSSQSTSNYYTVVQYKNIKNSWGLNFSAGDYITVSFWVKGTTDGRHVLTYFYGPSGYATVRVVNSSTGYTNNNYTDGWCNFSPAITEQWQRLFITYQINPNATAEQIAKDKHLLIRGYGGVNIDICGVQVEKSETPNAFTPYYYEENLFDKDNANVVNGYLDTAGMVLLSSQLNRILYIPCKPNTTYKISRSIITSTFRVATYDSTPMPSVSSTASTYSISGLIKDNSATSITITTGANAKYLLVHYGRLETDPNIEESLATIQIKEHIKTLELCELDDYSDYEEDTVNLFDYAKALLLPVKIGSGVTLTNNRDGSFTISGSGNTTAVFGGNYVDLTHEQTVKLLRVGALKFKCDYVSIPRVIIEGFDGSTRLFILDNGTTSVQTTTITQAMLDNVNFKLRYSFYSNSGNRITPLTIHPMVYQDGDGTFEPIKYKKSKDYIKKNTGKNLFDKDTMVINGAIDANNGIISASNNFRSVYIKVQSNTTYTIQKILSNRFVIGFASDDDINMPKQLTNVWYNNSATTKTITSPNDANYMLITITKSSEDTTPIQNILDSIQIEEGSTATEYEPYGHNEWYKCTKIGKYTFTGTSNENWYLSGSNTIKCNALDTTLNYPKMKTYYSFSQNHTLGLYSNYGLYSTSVLIFNSSTKGLVGLGARDTGGGTTDGIYVSTDGQTISDFKTKLANNPLVCYYTMETPIYEKITYQPLINQLNELQNTKLFEDTNYITVDTLNEKPSLDIDYFKDSHFSLWSLKTHNYGDFTLDAWDNIDYDLDGTHYLTLNNNNIKYEMSIMGDVESKIPTKQQEVTTNVIGGDDNTNIKMIKTTVDQLNGKVDIISGTQTTMQTDISDLQVANNTITSTVENIQKYEIGENDTVGLRHRISQTEQKVDTITNMFQITGGINILRNSAFLLSDDVWDFTDYGTNPYHTPLGTSYNSTLSGTTVSVAEIKARSMKIKSKSENITNLKTDGTKYTFNFYHKQDTDMTTTIKMYSTENNNIKAFNDIVITGQQPFTNYEVSFVPTYTNYTLEIIIANATSIGYAYLYDMMLNSGDKQPWQPASDEIYSTTLQMSRLGLQVYSVGDGTLTILGSDGLTSWETSDGRTKGRLVSKRTVDGDRVKVVTTQSVKLVSDATKTDEELAQEDKWVETTTKVSGKIAKVIYMESGVQ